MYVYFHIKQPSGWYETRSSDGFPCRRSFCRFMYNCHRCFIPLSPFCHTIVPHFYIVILIFTGIIWANVICWQLLRKNKDYFYFRFNFTLLLRVQGCRSVSLWDVGRRLLCRCVSKQNYTPLTHMCTYNCTRFQSTRLVHSPSSILSYTLTPTHTQWLKMIFISV